MKRESIPTKAATRPSAHLQQGLRTAVLRGTKDFASLKEEWDELYRNCPSATPFSSWEWLYSWWEVYGEGSYGLRLITLREPASGLLVGLLPLMARRGRLLLLGDCAKALYWYVATPYKDVLVREGWEEPVGRAGARALKEVGGWQVADLQELMPEAAIWELFREWEGPKISVPITDYVLMRAEPWEELLTSLSRKLRKTARRTLRHADQDGLRCEPADVEDAERAARTLVELHRELWRGRRIDPEDLTPRYEAFMQAAARRMTARGIGRISEFRRGDGEVLVSQFLLFDRDFVGAYVIGASEEASGRYQLETLTNWDAIEVAHSKGSAYVSSMFHASWDKLRWADEVVSSHRAILGRTKAFWVPYAGCHVLRARYYALLSNAQVYMHSEDAPSWIKKAIESYYALLSYPYSQSAPRWVKSATERYYELRHEYGYYALRYKYELAQARRQIRRSNASNTPTKR
jgi:CelD/BcsL family acetyltransferase involved in cellulose biosynthesis